MFQAFCKEKLGPLALRLAIGLFAVYHGYIKIMASGGTTWYPDWPVGWQVLTAWAEFCAGVAIVLGFKCRAAAGVLLIVMLGFLIATQGWRIVQLPMRTLEMTLLVLLCGLALVCMGGGGLAIDGRSGGGRSSSRK